MQCFRSSARWTRVALVAMLLVPALAASSPAQVVRGIVRSGRSLMPIDLATVTATDTLGAVLARAVTDLLGEYVIDVQRAGLPFVLRVRRLGFAETSAPVRRLEATDTVDFEFLMEEVASLSDAVLVSAEPSLNEHRLTEATRRGWKVYDPSIIALHRDRAGDFHQLLRALANPGLIMPRHISDCVRATRNNECLTIVVDNQVLGPYAIIQPSDIYFLAVLGASDARIQFGDRAPWGAIAVYTRSRLDQPPQRSRRRP